MAKKHPNTPHWLLSKDCFRAAAGSGWWRAMISRLNGYSTPRGFYDDAATERRQRFVERDLRVLLDAAERQALARYYAEMNVILDLRDRIDALRDARSDTEAAALRGKMDFKWRDIMIGHPAECDFRRNCPELFVDGQKDAA
jgi:hypothetical protein